MPRLSHCVRRLVKVPPDAYSSSSNRLHKPSLNGHSAERDELRGQPCEAPSGLPARRRFHITASAK